MVEFLTFGLKHHASWPPADRYVDARFLSNPPRHLWTLPKEELYSWFSQTMDSAATNLYLTRRGQVIHAVAHLNSIVAFYCFGGKHRSVFLAETFAEYIRFSHSIEVNVRHLDADR